MIFPPYTPISVCRVMRGVPLDNTYHDVMTFSSPTNRESVMMGFTKYIYSDLTPIKMQNAIRLPATADFFYDCNYIMFQNPAFTNRWFYAFITKIDYENINTCLLHFELDVWTTWCFDLTIHPSFVEREHISDDTIGNNLVPENLELGEYIINSYKNTNFSSNSVIVAVTSADMNGVPITGAIYSGIYSGLTYIGFNSYDYELLNQMIDKLTTDNKRDAIISIFMMPKVFFTTTVAPAIESINIDKWYTTINGYKPKNNKLFTYPFNFLYVTNYQGGYAEFYYEFFKNRDFCPFTFVGDTSPNPSIMMRPSGYKNAVGTLNSNEKMELTGCPQCAYTSDAFKAWIAQNAGQIAVNIGSSLANMAEVSFDRGLLGGIDEGLTDIFSAVAQVYTHSKLPRQAHGTQSPGVNWVSGLFEFGFYNMSITSEFAQIIDGFFDMFGYATNRLKVPNYTGRPCWNYVKTTNVKITGSIPFNDISKIRSIFDKGVTFWHDTGVGNYNRSNK